MLIASINYFVICAEFQETSLQNQLELKHEIEELRGLIRHLQTLTVNRNQEDSVQGDQVQFPLRNLEELVQCEEFLKISTNFEKQVS